MCLDAKKQKKKKKKKNEWFICTLKSSKNVHMRYLLEAEINKVSANVFKASA